VIKDASKAIKYASKTVKDASKVTKDTNKMVKDAGKTVKYTSKTVKDVFFDQIYIEKLHFPKEIDDSLIFLLKMFKDFHNF
jgi:hypothetical protein